MRYLPWIALSCFVGSSARAAEPQSVGIRYTTIFEQTDTAPTSNRPTAENALMKALIKGGATVINPSGRMELHARDLVKGTISDKITALDADVIVAATVSAKRDQPGTMYIERPEIERYRAALEAVLIAVDTKEVLETFSLEGIGTETDQSRAIQAAFERAGASLAKQILESTNRIARRVEIDVEGLPATATDRLRDDLLTISGAKSAKVVYASPERSKAVLFLNTSAPSGPELVHAIDRLPNAGVIVTGFSERTIRARYSMTRAVRIPIAFTRFSGGSQAQGKDIANYVGGALLAHRSLEGVTEEPVDLPTSRVRREQEIARLGLLEQDGLFLSGHYVERSAHFEISAEVRSSRPGFALLVRENGRCPKDLLLICGGEIGNRLLENLANALLDRRTEGSTPKSNALAIQRIEVAPELFPARAGAYRTRGIGRVFVENRSPVSATAGRLRVFVAGLMAEPAIIHAPTVHPRRTAEIPIVLEVREDSKPSPRATLELDLEYEIAGRREKIEKRVEVTILERYALDWREPDSIAAFVTERDEVIVALASRAIEAIPASAVKHPFARPAAIFRAMSGVGYQRDAAHPTRPDELDDVQLPIEALARGRGDCEDLAVLGAALSESIGMRALLVLTPSHVVLAIDSELPAQSAFFGADPKRVVVHKGRAFIPIETTLVGRSFSEAWSAGANVVARAREEGLEYRIVDIREAHVLYPAVTFKIPDASERMPVSWDGFAEELERLAAQRKAAYEKALREETNASASRQALLLLALGRGDAARSLLEEASARAPKDVALANNFANVRLALGDSSGALEDYQRALAKTKDSNVRVRVHLNAAVAANVDGKADLSHQHAIDAHATAKTPEARTLVSEFLASIGDGGLASGTESMTFDRVSFAARLRKALGARGRSSPHGQAADPSARALAADLVYWLGSEVAK